MKKNIAPILQHHNIELVIYYAKIATFRFIQAIYSHGFTNRREKLMPIGEGESSLIRGRALQANRWAATSVEQLLHATGASEALCAATLLRRAPSRCRRLELPRVSRLGASSRRWGLG
jgi:hypothetical protein